MIEVGKVQNLKVVRIKEFGVYLADPEAASDNRTDAVLLPAKQVPEGKKAEGEMIEVFVYRDSQDRLIATTKRPILALGEIGVLTVKDTNKVGAFLDWGLEKDILLPFHEQKKGRPLKKGDKVLVAIYLDKSGRLCATTWVYQYLSAESPYQAQDEVTGTVYSTRDKDLFVAVDNRYFGMIPGKDVYENYSIGQTVTAYVEKVRPDGKLDLTLRKRIREQIQEDADKILAVIDSYGGVLPFGENVSPEIIRREFAMSKNSFKRAVGHLYKEGLVELNEKCIRHISR